MKILVINAGSSSMKYQLIDMRTKTLLAKGLCDRIGLSESFVKHKTVGKDTIVIDENLKNHTIAIQNVIKILIDPVHGAIASMDEIKAVGHRVVHGGEAFSGSVVITEEVMQVIRDCIELAPLHNPPNIVGIEACQSIMPHVPMVAVFDTAFHQTMPPLAYTYAIPYEYYEKYKVRRYGFHGTSHKFIAHRAADLFKKPIEELKIITCHLGNGSSIAAVKYGKSIDTSMGFTPLEGVPMGTRSGLIDPAIITFLCEKEKISSVEVNQILNKKSGVLGVSGVSSDFRDLDVAAEEGNERARLALDLFAYAVKKSIGGYAAAMGGADLIVFAGGVGENNAEIREIMLSDMEYMGIELDKEANRVRGEEKTISKSSSKVTVMVVPTNEELEIANETKNLIHMD